VEPASIGTDERSKREAKPARPKPGGMIARSVAEILKRHVPMACAVTGVWRVCTGCLMLSSRTISRVTETGHGAKNMAIVRRFTLGLVRASKRKGSVKTKRKSAGWSPDYLLELLQIK
jgi:hypothetical protein